MATYHRTARVRDRVSVPMREIVDNLSLDGLTVLHFGVGRAAHDTLALLHAGTNTVWDYDPNSPYAEISDPDIIKDHYNLGIAIYVFNVLTPLERKSAFADFRGCCDIGIWTVRADKIKGTPEWDGVRTSAGTFQKSYTQESALTEWPSANILSANSSYITLWEKFS